MKRKIISLFITIGLLAFTANSVFAVQKASVGDLDISVSGRLDAFGTVADIDESPNSDGQNDDFNKVDVFTIGKLTVNLSSSFNEDLTGGVETKTNILSMEGG
ncbi:MAG TPA: hypothetical protein VMW66_02565, partial [Elusimicrobiales bacterium]|nr:hypothetical protein [Elusimicrobiales bacterium]